MTEELQDKITAAVDALWDDQIALTQDMVKDYIRHRLRIAGATEPVFDDAACMLVHEASTGVPRLINQLCDLSMVYAFSLDRHSVTRDVVQQVLDDGVFFGGGMETSLPLYVGSQSRRSAT